MRRLIVLLLFLISSVCASLAIMRYPGHVVVIAKPWMIDMPLWFVALALVLMFVFFYFVITSIDWLQFTWFRLKNWWRIRRDHRLYNKTQHGLTSLIEGRFRKAEKLLLSGIHEAVDPLMNYLSAAKAAQGLKAYDRRDEYIKKAYQVAPNAALAIGLTKAELEFAHAQFEQAAATLSHLRQLSPRHPEVLRLAEKVYVRLADWPALLSIVPNLYRAKVLTKVQYQQLEKNTYRELLQTATTKSMSELQQIWQTMPRKVRREPDVVCAYVKQLKRFSDTRLIEELIQKALKQGWQAELVTLYGTLSFTNINRQLVITGAWLKIYGEKPELLLTLGRLCARAQLWGRAKDYFKRCLALGPNSEASLAYGRLLEQLNETSSAVLQYRHGLTQLDGVS